MLREVNCILVDTSISVTELIWPVNEEQWTDEARNRCPRDIKRQTNREMVIISTKKTRTTPMAFTPPVIHTPPSVPPSSSFLHLLISFCLYSIRWGVLRFLIKLAVLEFLQSPSHRSASNLLHAIFTFPYFSPRCYEGQVVIVTPETNDISKSLRK